MRGGDGKGLDVGRMSVVVLGMVLWLARPVCADFEAGRQAYNRGDHVTARRELIEDAEGGDSAAQALMGFIYRDGKGVAKDDAEAVKWYRRSAEQGETLGQYMLGVVHLFGQGVPRDLAEAASWFRKAAEQGNRRAQYAIGLMHYRGDGVSRELIASYMWLTLAAKYDKDAAELLTKVGAEMTAEQREEARRLAAAWRPKRRSDFASTSVTAQPAADSGDYLSRRKSHVTALQRRGPAPQKWENEPLPRGVREVFYTSGERRLKAWLALPPRDKEEKVPAVVYFGGGFAMDSSDFKRARFFLEKGYAVLLPTLRGHNGNPGSFELFFGEVEDGRAAVRWLAGQPGIDAERIFTFGHSAGGAISALLSLWDDVPVRLGASSGGLYDDDTFYGWRWNGWVPFNPNDAVERNLRLLFGNTRFMKRPHIAYVGSEDLSLRVVGEDTQAESQRTGGLLTVVIVPGDHGSSLTPAISAFLKATQTGR